MSAPPLNRLLNHLRRRARPTVPASDRELLSAYTNGDQAAFAELVRRHGAMVRGVGRRVLGDAHAAEDVGQATFLVLARKAPVRAWDESVGGWLHGVAYRLALKARAAARRPIPATTPRQLSVEPIAEVEQHELRMLLDSELRRLPARYRGPLVLCYLEGRTRDEAARQLGVTVAAVKGRLERGRDMLRERLTRRGCCLAVGLTAAALAEDAGSAPISEHWADVATGRDTVPIAAERLANAAALAGHGGRWALIAGFVGLAATTAGLALGIGADPPQPPPGPRAQIGAVARTDRFGDPLPAGARARFGTTRWRAGGALNQVASAPDGKIVIAATNAGLQFWDAADGRPLDAAAFSKAKFGTVTPLNAVAISPDGAILATGSPAPRANNPVRLWNVATGQELPVPKQQIDIDDLAFAPDGKTLAGRPARGTAAVLWDVPSGRVIGLLKHVKDGDPPGMEQSGFIGFLAYAPDGRSLYIADSRRPAEVSVWDTATGRLMRTFPRPVGGLEYSLALSPDGTTIASAARFAIDLVDIASGRVTKKINTAGKSYLALAYALNGNTLAAGGEEGIDFYDVATGGLRFSITDKVNTPSISRLYVDPSEMRVYRSHRGRGVLQVWDAMTGVELDDTDEFIEGIGSLAIAADGHTLLAAAGHGDPRVRRWDINNGKEWLDPLFRLASYAERIQLQVTAFAPGGQYIAWMGLEVQSAPLGAGGIGQNPNGKFIPLPPDRRPRELLTIVDVATGKALKTMGNPRSRSVLTWSPDGKRLATVTADHDVQLWEGTTGTAGRKFSAGNNYLGGLAFSSDGKMLAATNVRPAAVTVWNVTNGDTLQKIALVRDGETDAAVRRATLPSCAAFSPDGKTLVVGVGRGIRRWDLTTGKELAALDGPPGGVAKCLFPPNGRLLIAGGADGSVWAWDTVAGKPKQKLAGHTHAVTSMVLTPDGKTLVTGSADTTILVWDITGW